MFERQGAKVKDRLKINQDQAERGDYGPGDQVQLVGKMVEQFNNGQSSHYERQLPNGRTIEIYLAPTPDGGVVAVGRDISKQKALDEKLDEKCTAIDVRCAERQMHMEKNTEKLYENQRNLDKEQRNLDKELKTAVQKMEEKHEDKNEENEEVDVELKEEEEKEVDVELKEEKEVVEVRVKEEKEAVEIEKEK